MKCFGIASGDPDVAFACQRQCCSYLERAAAPTRRVVDPTLASFIDLEGGEAAETLRQAALDRRYGKRSLSFNCFDVVIDADDATATLADAIELDGRRAVIPLNELVRDLSP